VNPTPYSDLNAILDDLVRSLETILAEDFVGAYLHGSFALGDFDIHSDIDFLVAIQHEVSEEQLAALQAMHARIYAGESLWAQHLEGSYFPLATLRRYDPAAAPLWYLDNTARELIRSRHCDEWVVRWMVLNSGITLAGRPPEQLIDPVPLDAMRSQILATMRYWADMFFTDPTEMDNRWYQPFAVLTYCRMLHTLHTGRVVSKPSATRWAQENLDPRWAGLIGRAWEQRPDPSLKVRQKADPDDLEQTLEFVRYALAEGTRFKNVILGYGQTSQTAISHRLFPLEREYIRCVSALDRSGSLTRLPQSERRGVIGVDGREYPLPTLEQIVELFTCSRELVAKKIPQGFDRLELTPMAAPIPLLMDRLTAAILRHSAEERIYQTRRSPSDAQIPVRVNAEKQVWIWETLGQALDTNELVYFPQECSDNHGGLTKLEMIHDGRFCAIPGWSVGLVESMPMLPQQGQGEELGGRRQLEIGSSPREYLHTLQTPPYHGETGKTLEDFITEFLTHLEETHKVSHDRYDDNALWLLGNYVRYVERVRSDLVPTGWWHRKFGRARLDAHRPGNKRCTQSWGAATAVRLPRP